MSRLYRHLVWLSAPQDPITDAMLTVDDEVEEVSIHRAAGVPPHVEIKLTNPGWGIYAAGAQRCAAIVQSDDGTMATAEVLARGTIRNLPDNIGKAAVTLTLECSGTTEETRLARNAAAREWQAAHPEPENEYNRDGFLDGDITAVAVPSQDLLLGRMERDADQVMVGRTLEWHCNPVTHAWSLHDFTVPMGTLRDVGETDPDRLSRSAPKGCPRRIKMRIVANWTPRYQGTLSIPPFMIPSITSLTGWAHEMVQGPGLSTGWSLQFPTVISSVANMPAFGVVTQDLSTRRVYEELVPGSNPPQYVRVNSGTSWSRHELMMEFRWFTYFFASWTASYDYSQQRRETIDLVLDVPTQEVTGLVDELELADMTVSNMAVIPRFLTDDRDDDEDVPEVAAPYDENREYQQDDLVLESGREYRLLAESSTGVFWKIANFSQTGYRVVVDERWKETGRRPAFVGAPVLPTAPAPNPTYIGPGQTVFDQRRGLAIVAAGFRIMRAKAAELIFEEFSLTVDREEFPNWQLGDTCRTLVPGRHDEPQKMIEGRVVGIVDRLRATGGDVVELTLKVGKGLGGDAVARPARIGELGLSDYVAEGYLDSYSTPWLTAGDDIEWSWTAEPLREPIDPFRLKDPFYSVLSVMVDGSAERHMNRLQALARSGTRVGNGLNSALFPPTKVSLRLKAIRVEQTLTRRYKATGTWLRAPRGITL